MRVRTLVALLRSLSGKYPWERYEPPYPPSLSSQLNSTTTVFLGEWLWHSITYKGWYAIKQRNQSNSMFFLKFLLQFFFCSPPKSRFHLLPLPWISLLPHIFHPFFFFAWMLLLSSPSSFPSWDGCLSRGLVIWLITLLECLAAPEEIEQLMRRFPWYESALLFLSVDIS